MPNGIESLENVEMGGVEQTIYLRGHDRNNPVMLFVHGGPGVPETAVARTFGLRLEEHFVVVHWDQRGAGNSCSPDVPDESLRLQQYLTDTAELVNLLRSRFGVEKIYLVGHSWGSILGVLIAELRNEEEGLQARLAISTRDLRQIPVRSIEESRLFREVQSAERLFTTIQGRYETARLAAASTIPDVRILDNARIPRKPLNDNRIQMAGVAFLGFLVLAIGAAILLDQMDPRVRYPEQVTQGFGMRILAWTRSGRAVDGIESVPCGCG